MLFYVFSTNTVPTHAQELNTRSKVSAVCRFVSESHRKWATGFAKMSVSLSTMTANHSNSTLLPTYIDQTPCYAYVYIAIFSVAATFGTVGNICVSVN